MSEAIWIALIVATPPTIGVIVTYFQNRRTAVLLEDQDEVQKDHGHLLNKIKTDVNSNTKTMLDRIAALENEVSSLKVDKQEQAEIARTLAAQKFDTPKPPRTGET